MILYLIKNKNIYIIKYQKYSLFYIYLLIFLNLIYKFWKVFHINKIIYAKFLIIKINFINKFIKIITLIMFYNLYEKTNLYLFYISNV